MFTSSSKPILFLLACICIPILLSAQSRIRGFGGHIAVGVSVINNDALNQELKANAYPEVNSTYFALGLGLNGYRNRLTYGTDIYGYMLKKLVGNNQMTIIQHYYAIPNLGYLAYTRDDKLFLFPSVGLGMGGVSVKLKPVGTSISINRFGFGGVLDGAVNLRMYSPIQGDSDNKIEWGVKVGYMYALGSKSWDVSVTSAENVPSKLQGFYFRFIFGMGQVRSKKKKPDNNDGNQPPAPGM